MDWIIRIRPVAFLDIEEGIRWYNFQKQGLGNSFLAEANTFIEKLKFNPFAFSIISDPVRRMTLKKFPYKILFIIDKKEVIIIGVIHHKRSNRYLRKRYKN